MELKSMILSPEEKKEYAGSVVAEAPMYPYGLRISLGDDAIDKLGLVGNPEAGQKLMLVARVEVVGFSQDKTFTGDIEKSLSLQITEMALAPDTDKKTDPEKVLYGAGEDKATKK